MAGNADEEADWIEFELDDMQVKDWLWTMPMRNGDSVEVVAEPTGKNHYVAYAVKRDGDDLLAVYPHATAGRKVHYRSFQGTSTYLKYGHYPTEQHKPFHLHENSKIMINLIRLGDDTDHGGKVITASSTMKATSR